nr:hypothetical protein [Acidisoma sp. L85]
MRQVQYADDSLSGGDEQTDPRPVGLGVVRELKSVHVARHMHIREQDMDASGLRLQYRDGVRGMLGLQDDKPGVGQRLGRHHPNQFFVFGDNNDFGFNLHAQQLGAVVAKRYPMNEDVSTAAGARP